MVRRSRHEDYLRGLKCAVLVLGLEGKTEGRIFSRCRIGRSTPDESQIIKLPSVAGVAPFASFASTVDERIPSEVSLYRQRPGRGLGRGLGFCPSVAKMAADV
jgi:hypothetical protein